MIQHRRQMKGGKLPVYLIKSFLNATYDPNPPTEIKKMELNDVGIYKLDKDISNETTRVYWDGKQCVIAIRGTNPTMNDWSNNLSYAMGTYKSTPRFKEAQDAYDKAVQKYGENNISVLGHSQGGGSSSFFPKAHEIITLNRAYKGESVPQNEWDIHATRDPVSMLLNLRKPPHDVPIKSISWNPLTNHSINILDLLPKDQMIGTALSKGQRKDGIERRRGSGREVNNGLTDAQIKHICNHFKIPLIGVFEKDDIDKLENGNYVINLNGHSHWTGLIKDPIGVFYWDSFGFPAPKNIDELASPYCYNNKDIQDINSTSCGYYTIAFLKFLTGKPNKSKLYSVFVDMFSNDTKQNEKILRSLLV